jgi:hypothetical protein
MRRSRVSWTVVLLILLASLLLWYATSFRATQPSGLPTRPDASAPVIGAAAERLEPGPSAAAVAKPGEYQPQ